MIRILLRAKKWTVKKTVGSYVVIIFMNSFNAVHAFTELLKWIDYVNNADLPQ